VVRLEHVVSEHSPVRAVEDEIPALR
jgi:hypothetical protein